MYWRRFAQRSSVWVAVFIVLILQINFSWAAIATRSIDTAYGQLQVPANPQRVVTIYEAALDTALAVGIHPVGAVASRDSTQVALYIAKQAKNIPIVGGPRVLNFEAILQAQPDLILASPFLTNDDYQRLSHLAPTIVPKLDRQNPYPFNYWRHESEFFAQALGKSTQLKERLAQFDQQLAKLRQQINPKHNATIALVRWNPRGPLVMSSRIFAGQLLQQLDFKQPKLASSLENMPHSDPLSFENLNIIDQDWLILATMNQDNASALTQACKQPVFAQMQVVKADHVLTVSGQLWSSAAGPLAAEAILADLKQQMLPKIAY